MVCATNRSLEELAGELALRHLILGGVVWDELSEAPPIVDGLWPFRDKRARGQFVSGTRPICSPKQFDDLKAVVTGNAGIRQFERESLREIALAVWIASVALRGNEGIKTVEMMESGVGRSAENWAYMLGFTRTVGGDRRKMIAEVHQVIEYLCTRIRSFKK